MHRTASLNEVSGRYIEFQPEFFIPEELRVQAEINHQASEKGIIEKEAEILNLMHQEQTALECNYESYLAEGVARELARINLPLSTYTEMYWKMDLHNLFHFLSLRDEDHAQKEIRDFAIAISEIIKPIVPASFAAYEEHIKGGVKLSKTEAEFVAELLKKNISKIKKPTRFHRILKEKFKII